MAEGSVDVFLLCLDKAKCCEYTGEGEGEGGGAFKPL